MLVLLHRLCSAILELSLLFGVVAAISAGAVLLLARLPCCRGGASDSRGAAIPSVAAVVAAPGFGFAVAVAAVAAVAAERAEPAEPADPDVGAATFPLATTVDMLFPAWLRFLPPPS